MSELTKCNYCSLKAMRIRAASRSVIVQLNRDEHGWTTATYSDQKKPAARFLELTNYCVC